MTMDVRDPEIILSTVNQQLSALLRREPLPLATGGTTALQDTLWVWGVLGGKDVGKSSLINALAGEHIVEIDETVGEGTFQPAAYVARDDLAALQSRFAPLAGLAVTYCPTAPQDMHHLAVLDLPDFDSLFAHHVDQVRRVAGVLDGIIWVTTPKKVGDARGIREIRRVLKARTNFVYVVNKMDWLLGQSAQPGAEALERMRAALRAQVLACDGVDGDARSFLISAKYPGAEAVLQAVARSRKQRDTGQPAVADPQLREAAQQVADDFGSLKRALTTPPSGAAAEANKQANLAFQVRTQAGQLMSHYRPRLLLEQLTRVTAIEDIEEVVGRTFPPAYGDHLLRRLNDQRALFAEWSSTLFRRRLAFWPLLGIVAWPLAVVGSALSGLRGLLPAASADTSNDPFRFDGVALEERLGAALASLQAMLARIGEPVEITLPEADALARQFRQDARAEAESYRSICLAAHLGKKPTLPGRLLRWILPLAVVMWFPLVQPLLASLLQGMTDGMSLSVDSALLIVRALSAGNVLVGLLVSFLILTVILAAVYAGATRDAHAALDRLRETSPDEAGDAWTEPLVAALIRPLEDFRLRLEDLTTTLERLKRGTPP